MWCWGCTSGAPCLAGLLLISTRPPFWGVACLALPSVALGWCQHVQKGPVSQGLTPVEHCCPLPHSTDPLALPLSDLMSVKRMMEKLGAPKTHLELKKMISEVTGGVSETISYQDFVNVMLGKRSAVLKL